MKKTSLIFGLIFLIRGVSFAQCDADHIVILNNFEFVPSELVIVPGESVAFIKVLASKLRTTHIANFFFFLPIY